MRLEHLNAEIQMNILSTINVHAVISASYIDYNETWIYNWLCINQYHTNDAYNMVNCHNDILYIMGIYCIKDDELFSSLSDLFITTRRDYIISRIKLYNGNDNKLKELINLL
jgi:hypothetical protein